MKKNIYFFKLNTGAVKRYFFKLWYMECLNSNIHILIGFKQ